MFPYHVAALTCQLMPVSGSSWRTSDQLLEWMLPPPSPSGVAATQRVEHHQERSYDYFHLHERMKIPSVKHAKFLLETVQVRLQVV
jgi:hypothetical protein